MQEDGNCSSKQRLCWKTTKQESKMTVPETSYPHLSAAPLFYSKWVSLLSLHEGNPLPLMPWDTRFKYLAKTVLVLIKKGQSTLNVWLLVSKNPHAVQQHAMFTTRKRNSCGRFYFDQSQTRTNDWQFLQPVSVHPGILCWVTSISTNSGMPLFDESRRDFLMNGANCGLCWRTTLFQS